MDRLEHIGGRIRLFRKHLNLTLEELAYLVHKSPSTLSKYEKGSVNIDVLTLSEIADALGIGIGQLTDYSTRRRMPPNRNDSNLFKRHDRFHVYYLYSPMKQVLQGFLEVTGNSGNQTEDNVVLYLGSEEGFDISEPLFIYTGTMTCDESYAYISMQNSSGMKDMLYIMIKTPQWMRNVAKGLVLSVSSTHGCPAASSMLFSAEEMKMGDELTGILRADRDEILEFVRQTNLFAPL